MPSFSLASAYCNEFDRVSPPVPAADLLRRIDRLADLGTSIIALTGGNPPEDACTIAMRARALGFTSTVGVVHDGAGQLRPLGDGHRDVVDRILRLAPSLFSFAQLGHFQENVIRGLPNRWRCRAGGRFLYVCEGGLVHYCSQQRGRPGIPLETYSAADLAREADHPKPCAPFCTVSCVHQVAMLDRFREEPHDALAAILDARKAHDPGFKAPAAVRILSWAFLDPRRQEGDARVALRALGVERWEAVPVGGLARRPGTDTDGRP